MKIIISYALLLLASSSLATEGDNSTATINEVLTRHFQALGATELLEAKSSYIQGELSLSTLTIPFKEVQSQNINYFFKQYKVLNGMDLSPPIFKKLNDQGAFFVIDETDLGRGLSVKKLPDNARSNWVALNTTTLSPLYYFKKMGFEITLINSFHQGSRELIQLSVNAGSGEEVKVYLDGDSYLIDAMAFHSYHPQLGMVEIKRTYEAYEKHQGLSLPKKWIDQRAGTDIVYAVTDIELSNEIDLALFNVEDINIESTLTSTDAKEVIDSYLLALEKQSPFISSNEKIKRGLLSNLKQGQYSKIESPQVFSHQLTDQIIAFTGDYHFGIDHNPELFSLLNNNMTNEFNFTHGEQKRLTSVFQADNELKKGFYYLKITEMLPSEMTADLIDSHMSQVADKKGLIIDLRDNTGGAASFNRYLVSYLLPDDTVLYERVFKDKIEQVNTVNTRHNFKSLKTMPVYVFVNKNTVSAGEQLAYILQNHQRATIIGERTFGAAHGSIDVPLIKGLIGLVPITYERHVLTKQDWEGSGVTPDITAAPHDLTLLLQQIGEE